MNRLQHEKSPYLRMHSQNPVDWYAWGDEAFDRARREDKPVLISVGYSACHWCHVIAHESFEDQEVAELLNRDFISVKVDREERPDVDAVYMDAVQLYSGSGGWPMTVLALPDGQPFFAATYLPKESLDGVMGIKQLLRSAAAVWRDDRPSAERAARELTRRMAELADRPVRRERPSAALCDQALAAYADSYDERWGGFGRAPKFPAAHNLLFLLRHYERTGHTSALDMVTGTLDAMYRGGIFDHIGGGFCRYSTDRQWLIPHFEKMLYDNALLLWAYADAYRVTGKALYRDVALRTAAYVLRELTSPEGAFYCAQDADSEGREGAYYVFTPPEVLDALGKEDGAWLCRRYGITDRGNFEGASVPNLIDRKELDAPDDRARALCDRLYDYRKRRMRLMLDDKVLTSWNALMIAALCAAAQALDRPELLEAARKADAFLQKRLTTDKGGLLLRYRDGESKGDGVLADYAYLTLALTELNAATGDGGYLKRAAGLADQMRKRFEDRKNGGYYLYSATGEQLVTRPKETYDSALPSGNSSAALALWRLWRLTGDERWQEPAREQLEYMAGVARDYPTGHGFALLAIENALEGAE